jgi:hypothetical protein
VPDEPASNGSGSHSAWQRSAPVGAARLAAGDAARLWQAIAACTHRAVASVPSVADDPAAGSSSGGPSSPCACPVPDALRFLEELEEGLRCIAAAAAAADTSPGAGQSAGESEPHPASHAHASDVSVFVSQLIADRVRPSKAQVRAQRAAALRRLVAAMEPRWGTVPAAACLRSLEDALLACLLVCPAQLLGSGGPLTTQAGQAAPPRGATATGRLDSRGKLARSSVPSPLGDGAASSAPGLLEQALCLLGWGMQAASCERELGAALATAVAARSAAQEACQLDPASRVMSAAARQAEIAQSPVNAGGGGLTPAAVAAAATATSDQGGGRSVSPLLEELAAATAHEEADNSALAAAAAGGELLPLSPDSPRSPPPASIAALAARSQGAATASQLQRGLQASFDGLSSLLDHIVSRLAPQMGSPADGSLLAASDSAATPVFEPLLTAAHRLREQLELDLISAARAVRVAQTLGQGAGDVPLLTSPASPLLSLEGPRRQGGAPRGDEARRLLASASNDDGEGSEGAGSATGGGRSFALTRPGFPLSDDDEEAAADAEGAAALAPRGPPLRQARSDSGGTVQRPTLGRASSAGSEAGGVLTGELRDIMQGAAGSRNLMQLQLAVSALALAGCESCAGARAESGTPSCGPVVHGPLGQARCSPAFAAAPQHLFTCVLPCDHPACFVCRSPPTAVAGSRLSGPGSLHGASTLSSFITGRARTCE